MPRYCSQADLERALGGAGQLTQLLAKQDPNIADAGLVNQVLDAASGEVQSYFINLDLRTVVEPYPPALVTKTADIAAFYAWRYGAYGQGIPESIMQGHDAAVRWAQDVGNKRAALGVPDATPNLSERLGSIDHDPDGHAVSIKGFKRGFR